MIGRRQILQAAPALAAMAAIPAMAQVTDLGDAINKAGRQRMLSQRVGKAYIALVQQVEPALAQQVLDRSMAQFDRQLIELKAFAPSQEVRDTYVALESAWSEYKGTLVGAAPSRNGVTQVIAQAGRVLAIAHRGTQQYEAVLGKPSGKLVNVAGRQRMLSQRMAAYYLASTIPVDAATARAEIAKARTEFAAGLDFIRSAPEATARIREELQLAEQQWVIYDAVLQRPVAAGAGKPGSDVFIASENLLQVMDRITGLYAGLKA